MDDLKISKSGDYFLRNGKGFFYLADTVWSGFTNASFGEWEEYLDYRRLQGFNVLQMNILPQWDRSRDTGEISPFGLASDGKYDFCELNEEYFSRADKMLAMAVQKGFVPALVLLWCDFVKDTWASRLMPSHIMPLEAVRHYTEYAADRFSQYHPVYLVSGDTDFISEDTSKYYMLALETLKGKYPDAVTAMHLAGGLTDLPEGFVKSPLIDFYMYQSGHVFEQQHLAYKMAETFCSKTVKRPVVNGEPCYEGHGYGNRYGRFGEFDVRKAAWQSLLSGAKAGITYGAHGIWSWHRRGSSFPSTEFSSMPYDWREALRFEGAWDVSFAKHIFELYDLFGIVPSSIIKDDTGEVRCSVSKDLNRIAIYAPYNADIALEADLSGYDMTLVSLSDRRYAKPHIICGNGKSIIKMSKFNSDTLIIGIKQQ